MRNLLRGAPGGPTAQRRRAEGRSQTSGNHGQSRPLSREQGIICNHRQPGRFPRGAPEQLGLAGGRARPDPGGRAAPAPGQVRRLRPGVRNLRTRTERLRPRTECLRPGTESPDREPPGARGPSRERYGHPQGRLRPDQDRPGRPGDSFRYGPGVRPDPQRQGTGRYGSGRPSQGHRTQLQERRSGVG